MAVFGARRTSGPAAPVHWYAPGRRVLAGWLAVFACYGIAMALTADRAESFWGLTAGAGYAVAAVVAWRSRGRLLPPLLAVAGAVAVPSAVLPVRLPALSEIGVVTRSAELLLRYGNPYLPAGQLLSWRSYDPYLPLMAAFGLPGAVGLPGVLGDPRLWLGLTTVAALAGAFAVVAPHGVWCRGARRCGPCGTAVVLLTALAVASPMVALDAALGVNDPPILGLLCLALACVARSTAEASAATPGPDRRAAGTLAASGARGGAGAGRGWLSVAALAVGVTCAMKATAWPALPVLAAMLATRDGWRTAARFTAVAVGAAVALVLAAAPTLARHPNPLVRNTVMFPLGLARYRTPASSPLPGHLLAGLGPDGHLVAIGVLLAAGAAVGASLVVYPLRDASAAALRLALGLTLMIALAPDARFGYLFYPLGLLGWLALAGRAGARTAIALDRVALDGVALDGVALDGAALDGAALDGAGPDGATPGTRDRRTCGRSARSTATAGAVSLVARCTPFLEQELLGLRELVEPGSVCVDVGAAAGLYTVTLSRLAGPAGQVHGIEPLSFAHPSWSRLLAPWQAPNVRQHPVALGAEPGNAVMSVPVGGYGPVTGRSFLVRDCSGLGSNSEFRQHLAVPVRVQTLDGLCARAGLTRLDFVKIDVEGAELAVLEGGRQAIEAFRPVLLVEIEARHAARYGNRPDDIAGWLIRRGYAIRTWRRGWLDTATIEEGTRNYLFVPVAATPRAAFGSDNTAFAGRNSALAGGNSALGSRNTALGSGNTALGEG